MSTRSARANLERDSLRDEMQAIQEEDIQEDNRNLKLKLASLERRFKAIEFYLNDFDSPQAL